MVKTLVVVLGDQLSPGLASLAVARPQDVVIVMAEVAAEATYVAHHKKKIAFLFSAMRRFAQALREAGFMVDYRRFDDADEAHALGDVVAAAARRHDASRIKVVEPGEWRVLEEMRGWSARLSLPVDILDDDRFLCSHADFAAFAGEKPHLRMEYFYRYMRKRTGLLMDGDAPEGGRWNFDAENRAPARGATRFAGPLKFAPGPETRAVIDLVGTAFAGHFGDLEPFWFATSRAEAEEARAHFMAHALPQFGATQDAMLRGEHFLNHAMLSLYLNAGLLDPLETCRLAEREYTAGRAPLNAVEGFIRQIIGWREFIRGVYWREGPLYTRRNGLAAHNPLPDYFWSGETGMACVGAVVRQTREEAYAHHIQRLMVTGNFALLAGIDPHAVHEWYLAVYADAYEWVEAPNVIGMALFADGGVVASKPYAASGAYINRMSDYCKGCAYDVKKRVETDACPFNALYWDFIARNGAALSRNGRMAQAYRTWSQMGGDTKDALRRRARVLLEDLGGL